MTLEELKSAADALPPAERSLLAEHLLASLDDPADEAFDRELERRLEDYRSGRDPGVSAEEALAELRRGRWRELNAAER